MPAKAWFVPLPLLLLIVVGCNFPVRQRVDDLVCERASAPADVASPQDDIPLKKSMPDESKLTGLPKRLRIPADIPGADAPLIFLPRDKKEYKSTIEVVIKEHFPLLPKIDIDPDFPPGPDGQPLTLSDLQRIAFSNSPLLRQSAADIEAARGNAIQVGAYPNPTLNYNSTGVGPSGGPTVGVSVSQVIKTGGKLVVAQAAALENLKSMEIAYRRAEMDLRTAVRTSYYAVLVAQESIRANRGLVQLTDEVYRVMVDQLRGGEVATYEPLQIKVFANQARTALVTARNARVLAWKQLASAMGTPFMPPAAVTGNIHRAVPALDFDKALAHVLTRHTDVQNTSATIAQARYNLQSAQRASFPDVTVTAGVENDLGLAGPSRLVSSFGVSVPVPVWDRNRGGIMQSQGQLVRAIEEPHRVQADLAAKFSEAYRRYDENRILMKMYTEEILPNQIQAFRAVVKRHDIGDVGGVAYNDLVTSEQNLVTVIPLYITVLTNQWQAVVDVSNYLQTDQLYNMVEEVASGPCLNLDELLKLPCRHPCSNACAGPEHGPGVVDQTPSDTSAGRGRPRNSDANLVRPASAIAPALPSNLSPPRAIFLRPEAAPERSTGPSLD